MVNLWWVCGEACPLAGSYEPRCGLVKIFLVFEVYFWVGRRSELLNACSGDAHPETVEGVAGQADFEFSSNVQARPSQDRKLPRHRHGYS